VRNQTLGFQKLFVLNLPPRTDHKDALSLAAALTDIRLDWIDGMRGDDVLEKVLPPGEYRDKNGGANKGSWRAHMNAILTVVQQNLTSALIMEDDVDWDVRIKDQLQQFALSSRTLIQPLSANASLYADPTFPIPQPKSKPEDLLLENIPHTIEPSISPYGDNWDVLWLGHCGVRLPTPEKHANHPMLRIVHHNDLTVPGKQFIKGQRGFDDLAKDYPPHTRVVAHAAETVCSLAYAVSQRGARRLLYELGVNRYNAPFDIMLDQFCDGTKSTSIHGTCISAQPEFFSHHRPRGKKNAQSEIDDHGEGFNEVAFTKNIQWSVRSNYRKLLLGEQVVDQWRDDEDA